MSKGMPRAFRLEIRARRLLVNNIVFQGQPKFIFIFSKLRLLPNIDNPRSYDVFEGSIINPKEDVAACA